jgi:hypothetical protein
MFYDVVDGIKFIEFELNRMHKGNDGQDTSLLERHDLDGG